MSGSTDREQTPTTTPPPHSRVPTHTPGPWYVSEHRTGEDMDGEPAYERAIYDRPGNGKIRAYVLSAISQGSPRG